MECGMKKYVKRKAIIKIEEEQKVKMCQLVNCSLKRYSTGIWEQLRIIVSMLG